jgi:hypothetical protein
MRWRTTLAVILAASLLVACGDDDAATESTTTTEAPTTASAPTTEPEAEATEDPADATDYTVTVEDPGAEPRHQLRLQAEVGGVDRITQRQEMSIEVRAGDQVQSAPSSVTEMDVDYAIEDVTDQTITTVGRYVDVRVLETPGSDPAANAEVAELLQGFRSATARTTYTTRGAVQSAEIEGLDLAGSAGPMAEQFAGSLVDSLESLSMPFPEEAVGAGARWRIDTAAVIAGLPVEITTVIVLDEVDEGRAVGSVEQELRFVPGDVDVFGSAATVVSGELRGGGPIEWNLAGGIVPRSDVTTSGTIVLEVQNMQIEQSQTQRVTITGR